MINFEDYINSVEARLKDHRYQVVRDEKLPDNSTCELVATRRYFSWKGFVMLRQYVFVNYITKPTVEESRTVRDWLTICKETELCVSSARHADRRHHRAMHCLAFYSQ